MRQGRLSLDQVGVIAHWAAEGSDEHYAQLAGVATVSQLRTAVNLEPQPEPGPRPEPQPTITKTSNAEFDFWRIALPHADSAKFAAALQSHRDALIAEWKRDRDTSGGVPDQQPPMPTNIDAFMRLVETGWDAEVQRRPHGQHTTVVMHLDVKQRAAYLHLGPLLSDAERQYLTCDATCEVWFQREGDVIGLRVIDPHDQPPAAPRTRAPPPQLRGSRLCSHPRPARPSHPALGRRRWSVPITTACIIEASSPSPDQPATSS